MFKFGSKAKAKGASEPSSADDTPWAAAGRAHDDRVMRSQAQVANWRLFAFFCLAIAGVSVLGVIWLGGKSKFVPMVFEVDRLGQVIAVKALYGDEAVTDNNRVVYSEMFELFEHLRTVTTDRNANNYNLNKGFSRLSEPVKAYVREELRKAPPNEVGATKTIQVIVRSALKLQGNWWQVDWDEISFGLDGKQVGEPAHWRATLLYANEPSPDPKVFAVNSTGFTVKEMHWQQIADRSN
jgi:type IV secretion system protein VirB5